MTTIAAVVCTLGRPEQLRRALDALVRCDPPADEVLVVDGDEHRSAEPVVASFTGARYVASPRGLTRQRNRGLAEATADVVAFFDDDAYPEPDVFGALRDAYADPAVVGATGTVREPESNPVGGMGSRARRFIPGAGRPGTFTRYGYPNRYSELPAPADVELMPGCFMTARRVIAADVRFDETLPGYALAEDEDFSYRLSRRGRIRYLPAAVVHHDNAGFGGRDRRAFNRSVVVNRAYLFRKNFPQTLRARLQFVLLVLVLAAHRALNRDGQGLRGLLDGVIAVLRRR